jgi:hypothetical protein
LLGSCLGVGFGIGFLQCANDFLEGQAVRFQKARRGTFPVPDNGRQHDRAVDLAAPRLLGGLHRRVQDAQQFRVGRWLGAILCPHVLEQTAQIAGDVGSQAEQVDAAGLQHRRSIRVFGKRQQQVLERYCPMALLAREAMRPLEAFAKSG